jgi:hypothetical protein
MAPPDAPHVEPELRLERVNLSKLTIGMAALNLAIGLNVNAHADLAVDYGRRFR